MYNCVQKVYDSCLSPGTREWGSKHPRESKNKISSKSAQDLVYADFLKEVLRYYNFRGDFKKTAEFFLWLAKIHYKILRNSLKTHRDSELSNESEKKAPEITTENIKKITGIFFASNEELRDEIDHLVIFCLSADKVQKAREKLHAKRKS